MEKKQEIKSQPVSHTRLTAEHLDLLLVDPKGDVTGQLMTIAGAVLVPGDHRTIREQDQRRRGQGDRGRARNWPRRVAAQCHRRPRRGRCRQVLHASRGSSSFLRPNARVTHDDDDDNPVFPMCAPTYASYGPLSAARVCVCVRACVRCICTRGVCLYRRVRVCGV